MSEFKPLIDQLYREEIARAREQTPAERFAGAFEITDFAFGIMESGIRAQHPDADDAEVLRIARKRLAICRAMDESKRYRRVNKPGA